ncbi:MAG: hypothetical protein ABIO61_06655 [Thermomonas sp.]
MNHIPTLLAMILLLPTACATNASTTNPADGADHPATADSNVTLGLGQTTVLNDGSRLSYTSLVNDSRCAPDVQCIWAGDAEIAMQWAPAHANAQDLRLHTSPRGGPTSTRIGERTLTLVSLERGIEPKASLTVTSTP